jgi:flagellar basal body rod protein FlgG
MFLSPSLHAALDRIAERVADVRRAYTPGAIPRYDDVAIASAPSDASLDPLAVVPPSDLYFVTADDEGQRLFTRDGELALHGGTLSGPDGQPILGMRTASAQPTKLSVDPIDEALERVRNPTLEPDGTFAYSRQTIDPRTGSRELQRVVVGRIALARFPAGTRLQTDDGSHCRAPSGVAPRLGFAGDEGFSPLVPMRREHSRIDVDESLARLKDAYLTFDALQAAEAVKAHLGKTTMDLLK